MADQVSAFSNARESPVAVSDPIPWLDRDPPLVQDAVAPRLELVRLLLSWAEEPTRL